MTFNNKDIVVDTWDVHYIEDPFSLFENLHLLTAEKDKTDIFRNSVLGYYRQTWKCGRKLWFQCL